MTLVNLTDAQNCSRRAKYVHFFFFCQNWYTEYEYASHMHICLCIYMHVSQNQNIKNQNFNLNLPLVISNQHSVNTMMYHFQFFHPHLMTLDWSWIVEYGKRYIIFWEYTALPHHIRTSHGVKVCLTYFSLSSFLLCWRQIFLTILWISSSKFLLL